MSSERGIQKLEVLKLKSTLGEESRKVVIQNDLGKQQTLL